MLYKRKSVKKICLLLTTMATGRQPYLYVVCCLEESKTAWLDSVVIHFVEIGKFYLFFPDKILNFQQDM
jgi:hypothetical protein